MTLFWISAVGMMVLALAFVAIPLLRKNEVEAVDADALNLTVFRDQLKELDADLTAGNLDQEQYDAARKDLEKELLLDVSPEDKGETATQEKSGTWALAMSAVLVPVLSISLYLSIGSPGMIDPPAPPVASSGAPHSGQGQGAQAGQMEEMVAKLAARLEKEPNDPQGWVMLARSYMAMQRIPDGLKAYEQAEKLAPNDPNLLLAYAEAIVTTNGNNFFGKPTELVRRAFALSPESPNVLWMAGIVEFRESNFVQAYKHWEKAANIVGKENPQALAAIESAMNDARSKIVQSGGTVPEAAQQAAAEPEPAVVQAAIQVTVSLDEALLAKVDENDRLFIFAKAENGPRMPLAAVADKLVKDLPVTVELNDAMAMMPQLKLSGFPKVTVGARISKSGAAIPQSGDLEGNVNGVNTTSGQKVAVVINSVRQ